MDAPPTLDGAYRRWRFLQSFSDLSHLTKLSVVIFVQWIIPISIGTERVIRSSSKTSNSKKASSAALGDRDLDVLFNFCNTLS